MSPTHKPTRAAARLHRVLPADNGVDGGGSESPMSLPCAARPAPTFGVRGRSPRVSPARGLGGAVTTTDARGEVPCAAEENHLRTDNDGRVIVRAEDFRSTADLARLVAHARLGEELANDARALASALDAFADTLGQRWHAFTERGVADAMSAADAFRAREVA